MNRDLLDEESKIWEQMYYWCYLNITEYIWTLWYDFSSCVNHPYRGFISYMGFIGGSTDLDLRDDISSLTKNQWSLSITQLNHNNKSSN